MMGDLSVVLVCWCELRLEDNVETSHVLRVFDHLACLAQHDDKTREHFEDSILPGLFRPTFRLCHEVISELIVLWQLVVEGLTDVILHVGIDSIVLRPESKKDVSELREGPVLDGRVLPADAEFAIFKLHFEVEVGRRTFAFVKNLFKIICNFL